LMKRLLMKNNNFVSDNSLKYLFKYSYLSIRGIILNLISYIFKGNKIVFQSFKVKRVLIIAPPRIGDVAVSIPVYYLLKKKFPDATLHVLANNYTLPLLSLIKTIDHITCIEDNFAAKFKFVFKNIKKKFDLAVDLNFDYYLWPAFLISLTGFYRVGYNIHGRGFLFDIKLPAPDFFKHSRDIFLQPVRVLSDNADIIMPEFKISKEYLNEIDKILGESGISKNDKFILIHPGSHHKTQQWLMEYFAETADRIIESGKAKLILVGDQSERYLIDNITSLMKSRVDVILFDLNVINLVGLIFRSTLLICNNSGPLHIAAALNRSTVSTMGPTVKERWMPLGNNHKVLRMNHLPCIGCNLGYCKIKTHDCMRLIKPSHVMDQIKHFI